MAHRSFMLTQDQCDMLCDALVILSPSTDEAWELRGELLDLLCPATNENYVAPGAEE